MVVVAAVPPPGVGLVTINENAPVDDATEDSKVAVILVDPVVVEDSVVPANFTTEFE